MCGLYMTRWRHYAFLSSAELDTVTSCSAFEIDIVPPMELSREPVLSKSIGDRDYKLAQSYNAVWLNWLRTNNYCR